MGYLSKKKGIQILEKEGIPSLPVQFKVLEEGGSIGPYRYDLLLEADWEGESRRFIAEYKRRSTPKNLQVAVQQVKKCVKESEKVLYPMVVVPYLDSENIKYLESEEVNGIDLCGNGVIRLPGDWYIRERGNPNQYSDSRSIKNVFKGKSSLVPRLFLVQPEFETVNAIVEEIQNRNGQISQSTVSRVLKRLEEELLISREGKIKLLEPEAMLNKLEQNYRSPEIENYLKINLTDKESTLVNLKRNARDTSEKIVGYSPNYYTVLPQSEDIQQIYTTSIETILSDIRFEETEAFPDIFLRETNNAGIYFDSREKNNFAWCSPVQTYLQLRRGDKREREAAEQIKRSIVKGVEKKRESN